MNTKKLMLLALLGLAAGPVMADGSPDGSPAGDTAGRHWFVKMRHGNESTWSKVAAHSSWSAVLVASLASQLFRANARLKAKAKLQKAEHDAGTRFISQEDAEKLDKTIHRFFNMAAFSEMLAGHLKGTVLRGNFYDIINAWVTNLLLVERGCAIGEHVAGASYLKAEGNQE